MNLNFLGNMYSLEGGNRWEGIYGRLGGAEMVISFFVATQNLV